MLPGSPPGAALDVPNSQGHSEEELENVHKYFARKAPRPASLIRGGVVAPKGVGERSSHVYRCVSVSLSLWSLRLSVSLCVSLTL